MVTPAPKNSKGGPTLGEKTPCSRPKKWGGGKSKLAECPKRPRMPPIPNRGKLPLRSPPKTPKCQVVNQKIRPNSFFGQKNPRNAKGSPPLWKKKLIPPWRAFLSFLPWKNPLPKGPPPCK